MYSMSGALLIIYALVIFMKCQPSLSASNYGSFYQISDIHYDPLYGNGAVPSSSCSMDVDGVAFPYGNYSCDSPWALVKMAIQTMSNMSRDVDFIIWTGDTPASLQQDILDNTTVLTIIGNVSQTIRQYFPNTTVFTALGNHDNYRRHLLQPEPNAFRNEMAELWSVWLNDYPFAIETFETGGFYRAVINENLWAVVLNTAFYYYKDTLTDGLADPAGQFAWLEKTLQEADDSNKKVFIVAHVPPGSIEGETWISFQDSFNKRYLDIIRDYSHVIKGQFYGHHHFDSFRVLYDHDGTPINALFIQPSLTPRNATALGPRNPSFRIGTYDRNSGDIIDIEQYFLDLTNNNPIWALEYRATESYEIEDLSPESLHELVQKFSGDDSMSSEIFMRYFRHNTAMAGTNQCDKRCKRYHVCAITKLDIPDYEDCVTGNGPMTGGPIDGIPVAMYLLLHYLFTTMMP